MVEEQLIIAGFGGQGILFIGRLLAYVAMREGKEVTYLPSYGPEMRGGTANCTVIIAPYRIMSPLAPNPSSVIAMNLPSMRRFEPVIKEGGMLVYNSSMGGWELSRSDIRSLAVPANEIAQELGNPQVANMVMLGGYVGIRGVVNPQSIITALPQFLKEARKGMIELNAKAFQAGLGLVTKA
jgi:2-oxoglutarate ferredoxin oxidoreductase subunit gamma